MKIKRLFMLVVISFILSFALITNIWADAKKSVILMIGDGMGMEEVKLARLVELGDVNARLEMEKDPNYFLHMTSHSYDNEITDSAAAATAMACGIKTNNHMIGVKPNGKSKVESILEYAKNRLNKSVGMAVDCRITHATPAGFAAHVDDRNSEEKIAKQYVKDQDIDVFLGGGKKYFDDKMINYLKNKGYSFVETKDDLMKSNNGKVYGLFTDDSTPKESDRDRNIVPSLAERTSKAIEILSQDQNGFFLMVEGSQIDNGGHDNDKKYNALQTIEFDKAVKVAKDYVKEHKDTILIVTADHETGGLLVRDNDMSKIKGDLPSPTKTDEENEQLCIARADQIDLVWTSPDKYHTSAPLGVFIFGKDIDKTETWKEIIDAPKDALNLSIDNTEIYKLIKEAYAGIK